MYINADAEAGSGTGVGGPTGERIETRTSVIALWEAARGDLEAAGATVVEVDFPVVSNYEGDRAGAPTIATRGLVSPEYLRREIIDLSAWGWEDFLAANGDPALSTLAAVDGARETLATIRRNLRVSLIYNLTAGALAISGVIHPLIAAAVMPLSSFSVLVSSLRSRAFREGP